MFIDRATIKVKSGAGGPGAVTFRREKYVPYGGPSGGDGGNGGSVILEATEDLQTLLDFRYKKEFVAEPGGNGQSKNMFGKNAANLTIRVPVGTVVYNADTNDLLADLSHAGETFVAAPGGKGGKGNAHFATPTNRAPQYAEPGTPGVELNLRLELKLLADVGLVGLPNAGKSTLISVISAAKPKIADYPFTTLYPNLGVVRVGPEQSFVVADVPGLIEGASEGAGLGHQFLRHLQRTRLLLHIVDIAPFDEGVDPVAQAKAIAAELKKYDPELYAKPRWLVLNKLDMVPIEERAARVKDFVKRMRYKGPVYEISALTREGCEGLIRDIYKHIHDRQVEEQGPVDIDPRFAEPQ